MISVMMMNEEGDDDNNCLNSQLWHACAGGMVQMPSLNSKVFYFPQGHAEHAASSISNLNFGDFPQIPPLVLCRVSSLKFMADPESDEVYAKIGLIPLRNQNDDAIDDGDGGRVLGFDGKKNENQENPSSFAKTLTQSDANNGGGFSVPRYCAETIFPRLDYEADPPVQNILAKDVHGHVWKFRHIYRGTPRRHLLTTGWSSFVNNKKLVAGDSIVFLRADNGELCVGIRRAKTGNINAGVVFDSSIYGVGFSGDYNKSSMSPKGKVSVEFVIEAAKLAANGQAFEVFYYPRASTPEFCVRASTVKAAMRVQWCPGMRFKMAFETEDSSRISWFMGTISSVHVHDQIRWPNSPWRLLQVSWDEPDLLQNVKRVNPWLVEMVSNMPPIHLSPFSPPPRKKLRIPQPPDFPLSQPPTTPANNFPASNSIQGARHNSQFGSDLYPQYNKTQSSPSGISNLDPLRRVTETPKQTDENISCLLTIGNSLSNPSPKKHNDNEEKDKKRPAFLLFGQPILTEQQLSESWSGDMAPNVSTDGSVVLQNGPVETSSDEGGPWSKEEKSKFRVDSC